MKKLIVVLCMLLIFLTGCQSQSSEKVTLTLAAAASLENAFEDEIIDKFEKENPNIMIKGTYDSSGKLQEQIEGGLEADIFFSAATKQMDSLTDEGYIDLDTRVDLLENKVVLMTSSQSDLDMESFDDILKANTIAIGDPEIVPAGQYAKEVLTHMNLYDQVLQKASLASNVTEVLNQVAEGSADVGIVYQTDAMSLPDQVTVICEAPEGTLQTPVVYPVAALNNDNKESAEKFMGFLQSDEVLEIFEKYGFTPYK